MKRRGFTLIELLAVIVILAIIALIASPIVIGVIEDSRKEAKAKTVGQIIATAKYYVATEQLKNESVQVGETTLELNPDDNVLSYDGEQADGGQIQVGEDGKVVITEKIEIDDYYCGYSDGTYTDVICSKDESDVVTYIPTLASVVEVGDWVNYDAGNWDRTVAIPAANYDTSDDFTFGGYTQGASRNNSVECSYYTGTNLYNGWRVTSVDKSTGVVKLVHAGTSECFKLVGSRSKNGGYNAEQIMTGSTTGTVVTDYPSTPRDWSEYVNPTYATGAHMFSREDFTDLMGFDPMVENAANYYIWGNLIAIRPIYWLGFQHDTAQLNTIACLGPRNMAGLSGNGSTILDAAEEVLGIRPVIELKPYIKTSGQAEAIVGTDGTTTTLVWQLLEPEAE